MKEFVNSYQAFADKVKDQYNIDVEIRAKNCNE